jgi:hypothetical protein
MRETRTTDRLLCPGCELPKNVLRKSPWVSVPVCEDCLFVWLDGASESREPFCGAEGVRRASRLRQGLVMETYEP